MEDDQKQHVLQNLDKLVKLTSCGSAILSYLVAKGIFNEEDYQQLDSIKIPMERAVQFYFLIQKRANSYEHLLEALDTTRQTEPANILRRITSSFSLSQALNTEQKSAFHLQKQGSGHYKPILFDVRDPVRLFTGRENEVAELHKRIVNSGNKNATVVSQMASVTGLGGIGKTELCRKYIQTHLSDYDGNVIWVNAEKEETIASCFIRLANENLRISTKDVNGKDKSITTVVSDVYEYFRDKKSLFVFDNAESEGYLATFLPMRVNEGPVILITSRDRDWKISVNVLELNVLSEHDAITFVKKGLNITDNNQDEEILKLVETMQNFPLALQQAVSYIYQRKRLVHFDIAMFIKSYKQNAEKVLSSKILATELNDYSKTTFTVWKMTTVLIATEPQFGQLANQILNSLAYLAADNIPRKIFSILASQEGDDDWISALKLLVKYSMVNSQPEHRTISIHRLVQEVTRIELRRQGNEENVIRKILSMIEVGLTDKSVSHLITAFEYASRYSSILLEFSQLPYKIVNELQDNQRLGDAKRFGLKALSDLKRLKLSCDDENMIKLELAIAVVDFKLYNYAACLPVFKDILQKFKRLPPNRYKERLEIEFFVAATLNELGKKRTALQILEKVNREKITLCGRSDWYVVNNIAQIYTHLKEYDDAINFFQEALMLCKAYENEKKKNESILIITQNMAIAYQNAGESDKAISVFRDLYYKLENSNDHTIEPIVAKIGDNLAKCLLERGNYEESKRIADKVYKKIERLYGPNSIATLEALKTIGRLKSFEKNHEEAQSIFTHVFEQYRCQLGELHPSTVHAKCLLVFVMSMSGHEKAQTLVQEVLQNMQAASGQSKTGAGNAQGISLESLMMYSKTLGLLERSNTKEELETLVRKLNPIVD